MKRTCTFLFRMAVAGLLWSLLMAGVASAQAIFSNPIDGTDPGAFNPFTSGQAVAANMTATGIGRGPGVTSNAGGSRYNTTSWTTSASSDANDYITFTMTPDVGYKINFTSFQFTTQRSNTGPQNFAVRSSLDGFATDILAGSIGTSAAGKTASLSAATFQNIDEAITFRVYAWGGTGGSGTFSINDFVFSGEIVDIPLAVSLGNIAVSNKGNTNLVMWNTYSETGSNRFIVERSDDGKQFASIGEMDANGFASDYSFEDQAPVAGVNYYRIRMIEDNSGVKLSKVVSVVFESGNNNINLNIFPNPVKNGELNLQLISGATAATFIEVIDMSGKVLRKTEAYHNGTHTLDISALPSGIYFVMVSNGKESKSVKISK